MIAPMDAHAIAARLREASAASDLSADKRLDAKLDTSAAAIESRLREASDLLAACRQLAAFGVHARQRDAWSRDLD